MIEQEQNHNYILKPFTPEIRLNIDYPRELNPQQLAAVTAPPVPALVVAGAGSGKTRTLTHLPRELSPELAEEVREV